jgi:uncharacterized protein (TIGR01244 family)
MRNRFRPDETRFNRRLARIARWDRPIAGHFQRALAWSNMVLSDHGIFRLVYLNEHQVTAHFWRAAQPAPHQIRAAAARGVKTIVNLRGGREYGSWPLEKEAADAAGLSILDFVVRSRGAPDKGMLLGARAFFAGLDYPVLVHCKSGADRAGFMAALYLLLHEGRPLAEAMKQLSIRYGHFRFAKTGILDRFFERYREEGLSKGLDFEAWVRDVYDPDALERDFKTGFWSDVIVDKWLRRE